MSAEIAPESKNDSFLKRPISSWLRLDGWMLIATLIIVAAVVTRLWDLGSRSYNHDEAIHAWESWKLYTGQGYIHNPIYHGPFLYHATTLIYFLFGHSDYTGRLSAAIFSIGSVALIFFLRRWLGNRGVLVAAALFVISPALLYYGRFIRHDAFSVFFTLLMFLGIVNYLEKREDKYLYLLVVGLALYFSNMETAFIQTFVFGTFVGLLFLYQWLSNPSKSWRELPAFDLMMVMGTLVLPLASPLGIKLVGVVLKNPLFNPVAYENPQSILYSGIIWGIFFVASLVIGLLWDARRWLVSAGIFYAIYIVLFTAFFNNPQGIATGQIGSLGYWLSQQGVRRGGQPWHYYLILLPLYEYLPLLFGIIGAVYYAIRGVYYAIQRLARPAPAEDTQAAEPVAGVPLVPMFVYWAVLNLIIFSWGGEKMPWLLVHLTLPFILLTGWFGEQLLNADWRGLRQKGGAWVALLLPLTVVAMSGIYGTLSSRAFSGTTTANLNQTMGLISGLALFLIVGLPFAYLASELGWRGTGRIALVVLFIGLVLFTVHNSWMAVYQNGDVAVETLIYAQGTPDEPAVMREMTTLSRRLTGGEKDLKVAYDDDSSWPFVWYFRDWPNARYLGNLDKSSSESKPVDDAVVIVGPENEKAIKPLLGNRYYRRQYRLIWWPIEDYKTLTPAKIWQSLTNPATRQSLWNIIMYRKYDAPLAGWPLVNTFAMYVRKDIATQLWDYGPETLGDLKAPQEDPYLTRYSEMTAKRAFSGGSSGQGWLSAPKGVAVDSMGRLYVADSGNHCIQVFDANGNYIKRWGSQGAGPGEFQQPWGVAVGPDGVVYVADTWNHRIQKFDREGRFLAQWGTYGEAQGQASVPDNVFYGPRGVAVDAEGNLWVTDTGNKRVVKFDPNGKILGQFGGSGAGDGQFKEPVGIAIDSQGKIYVADTWNRRVQVFDSQVNYLRQWPIEGWEGESADNKPYLAVDGAGNVYVTDPETYRVIKFSGEGQVLAVWGKRGDDMSSLNLPTGIVVAPQEQVLVADSGNQRVLEFLLANP